MCVEDSEGLEVGEKTMVSWGRSHVESYAIQYGEQGNRGTLEQGFDKIARENCDQIN